ncbi:hypothetical protein EC845_1184 [Comamonas sp. BIGb0124]|uniref:phage regulatory CII family protein n=1 Tax=Comamonas sp. BIGb0124 TaxID=2485130 RepID=UPI000F460D42|nr:phage regulatory CII family protein [Comamonas sp. BIGb0124]ROR25144.1 hypothetical protein EC845_1184 [Comamonas sp. BIGb0124]
MSASISVPPGLAYGVDEVIPAVLPSTDVKSAAYQVAHSYPGGLKSLAHAMDMPLSSLEKKISPSNETHNLSPAEQLLLQHLTGKVTVLQAMAHSLGYVVVKATPDQSGGDVFEAFAIQQQSQSDFMRSIADPLATSGLDGFTTGNEIRRIDYCAQELITATFNLVGVMFSRKRPTPSAN